MIRLERLELSVAYPVGLESLYTVKGIVGSNPTFSTIFFNFPYRKINVKIIFVMRYDKDELPIKEYYTEELKKSPVEKMKALEYQKYYTGGSIILMFLVLISMYLILN